MKTKGLLLLLLLLKSTIIMYSQELTSQEKTVEQDAYRYIENNDYEKAGERFSQLLSVYRKSPKYNFYFGLCLIEQNIYVDDALKYLKYAEKKGLDGNDAILINYYLGKAYHLNYEFDNALRYYKKFKEKYGTNATKQYEIDKEIRMAENGKELLKYISDLVVVENKKIKKENFYYSYKLDDYGGKLLIKPDEFKTKSDLKSGNKQLMFLSDSGIVLYSSYGKKSKNLDIYKRVKNKKGEWSEAIKLPENINTPYDDAYPYLRPDGITLYFSSKGHNTMGGYDIFRTVYDTKRGKYSTPVNLDFPINTPYDDYFYICDTTEEYAYFASNRETTGDKISVYKILIDKNPVKRQIENLQEIKSKSLMQVSPLALVDKTKAKNSEYEKKSQSNKSKDNDDLYEYNYERLTLNDIVNTEDAINVAESDTKKQEKDYENSVKEADKTLLFASKKMNEAKNILDASDKIMVQENLSETDRQKAENLKKQAKELEAQAILAINVYNNKKNDLNLKQKEKQDYQVVYKQVKQQQDVNSSVYIINKNREKSANTQQTYFSRAKETQKRQETLVIVKQKKSDLEPKIVETKHKINDNNNRIKVLYKQGNKEEAEKIKTQNKELVSKYSELIKQKEELVFEENKIKNELNLFNELESFYSETGDAEVKTKLAQLDVENLKKELDEKSFEIEVENKNNINKIVEKQKKQLLAESNLNEENQNLLAETNNIDKNNKETSDENIDNNESKSDKIENQDNNLNNNKQEIDKTDVTENNKVKKTTNSQNSNAIVPVKTKKYNIEKYKSKQAKSKIEEVNNNIEIIDSLNYVIAEKNKQLTETNNPEKKKQLQQDIFDLQSFVDLKTSKNEQLIYEANNLKTNTAKKTDIIVDNQSNDNNINKTVKYSQKQEADLNKKNLETIVEKNKEVDILYQKLNKNIAIEDSIENLIGIKQDNAQKISDENEMQIVMNEIDDLNQIVELKRKENQNIKKEIGRKESEINKIALNVNSEFNIDKEFPFEMHNDEQNPDIKEYKKQLFIQKYYEQKVANLKQQKNAFEKTKARVSSISGKQEIENEIKKIDEQINKNEQLSVIAKLKTDNAKKKIKEKIPEVSDEELFAEASSYSLKNSSKLSTSQKENIKYTNDDVKYAEDTHKKYIELTNEISELEKQKSVANEAEKKELEKQIEKKKQEADVQFKIYNTTYQDANFVEFQNIDNLIERYLPDNKEEPDDIVKLRNQAKAYFIQAKIIRDVNDDFNYKELEKAINYEKLAINIEKQALDKALNYQSDNTQLADNKKSKKIPVSLSLDEEEDLKIYNKLEYKTNEQKTEKISQLKKISNEIKQLEEYHSPKYKKKIEKLQEQKKLLKTDISEICIKKAEVDSLKYNVYKSKLSELQNDKRVEEKNKQKASEYINQADYFYYNAELIRKQAEQTNDLDKKVKLLKKANDISNTALINQEIALKILTGESDNLFNQITSLIKIDPLLENDKKIDVSDVRKAQSEEIIKHLDLSQEELQNLDYGVDAQKTLADIDTQIINKNNKILELEKLIDLTYNEKQKAKYQNKIEKENDELFELKYSRAEYTEVKNDSKFYVYKQNINKYKLKNQTEQAQKGNQLAKNANKYYNRAKTLRNKALLTDDLQRAYNYLLEANELETEGIKEIEKAYSIYLDIEPETIAKQLAENNTKKSSKIDNQIIEKKTADISSVVVNKIEQKQNQENETNKDVNIIENKQDTLVSEEQQEVLLVADNNQHKTNEFKEKNINTIEDISDSNKKLEQTKLKEQNNIVINTIVEPKEVKVETSNFESSKQLAENNTGKSTEKFAIYPVSVYGEENPIPINPPLPEGIIFKVQVGAFKNKVRDDAFNGLSPLAAEKIPGSAYTRYLVGQFKTYEAGKLALNEIKTIGYKDAFIVAYKNGKRVPLYIAKTDAQKSVVNYNDLALQETKLIKSRVEKSSYNKDDKTSTNNQLVEQETSKLVKAPDIKAKKNLLYTVQIGVYKNPVPHSKLYNLNPIYEDKTQYGFIRYTTGVFKDLETANIEKNRIRKLGIKDAFVTAYYNGKRISISEADKLKSQNVATENDQSIELPQINAKHQISGNFSDKSKVNFKVQIGAYKTQIPVSQVAAFLSVSRTKNLQQFIDDRGYTVFAIGNYDNYNEAAKMKTILVNEGVKDAFIVAYYGNKRISVAKAQEILNR